MKRTLVLGSATTDIIIHVDHLPSRTEDLNIPPLEMQVGGCAYHVGWMLHLFDVPYLMATPMGSGLYGEFVKQQFRSLGLTWHIERPEAAGACLCLVEPDGERSFLAHHGIEYHFHPDWMNGIATEDVDSAYVCGLEMEEDSGEQMLAYLRQHPDWTIYFAPGPRFDAIEPRRLSSLLALSPILHLNEQEILSHTHTDDVTSACAALYAQTHNDIIVTQGSRGCLHYDGMTMLHMDSIPTDVADTIGAGDAHLGSYISARQLGYDVKSALRIANTTAAAVVSVTGGQLSAEAFASLNWQHMI